MKIREKKNCKNVIGKLVTLCRLELLENPQKQKKMHLNN